MLVCDYQALLQDMNWTRSANATNARLTIDGVELMPEKVCIGRRQRAWPAGFLHPPIGVSRERRNGDTHDFRLAR